MKQISSNLEKYGKKTAKGWEIDLSSYKILGEGEVIEKLIIKAKEASKSAIEKIEKVGGKVILPVKKVKKVVEKKEEEVKSE